MLKAMDALEMFGEHERSKRVARAAAVSNSIQSSIYVQLNHEPILLKHSMQTQVLLENKSFLLQQCRVSEVIVFYPKPTNWGKSKNNQETFRDQIFITRIILSFFHSTQKRSSYMVIVVMDARRCVHMNFYQDSCLGIRQDLRGRSVITPNVTAFRIAYHKLLHLRHTKLIK